MRDNKGYFIKGSIGGSDEIGNIQPLCQSCNTRKWIKSTNYTNYTKGVNDFLIN